MKLYHYNTCQFDYLQSIYGRGITSKDRKRLGDYVNNSEGLYAYVKNLSFFMEPIPLDLPKILHNEHEFWLSGRMLFEHVVDTKDLNPNVPYRLVESTEKTDLIFNKQDWDRAERENELVTLYKTQIAELEEELELTGIGVSKMVKVASRYKNLRKSYQDAYKLYKKHPEDKLFSKYAACVPHLMIYTAKDKVKVESVKEIVLE